MSELHDEQPPEPVGPDPEDETAAEAPAPDFSQFAGTPEFTSAVEQAAQSAIRSELAALAEQANQPEEPELDFLAEPDELRQNLEGLIKREIQQAIAPMLPAVEQMELANWQDKIERTIGEIPTIKEIDQLLPEDHPDDQRASVMVERMATAFLPEMRQLYGDSDRALEASLRAAADYVLPIAKAMHGSGYAARSGELQRLSGARAPAPEQGGAAEIIDEPLNELEAAERYANRNGLT
jgi:hypothetical protein